VGTPGHIAHPFDVEEVKTGQDLVDYIEHMALRICTGEIQGSVKWDGINTSLKLVTNPDGKKEFRMDRGTSAIESVVGFDAAAAKEFWAAGHGMPVAIKAVLDIFNSAIPEIERELKTLGLWEDPTKYLNMEYIKSAEEGKSNVQEYDINILAIHGINQFYEKKAQEWRIRAGKSMDRPGMPRPVGPDGKLITATGIEIPYNHRALANLILKVKPVAHHAGFTLYGDVPVECDEDAQINFEAVLEDEVGIRISPNNVKTATLRDWLQQVKHPQTSTVTRKRDGKTINALSKDVYLAMLRASQRDGEALTQYLEDPKDVPDAINGAMFYHATRVLGQAVKDMLTSEAGRLSNHEGVVLRGMEDFLVKLTGDFIIQGLASTHGDHPDLKEAIFRPFTVRISKDREVTNTLNDWLTEIRISGHKYQKPPSFVYEDILTGTPITEIVQQEFAQEMIYNAVLTYASTLMEEEELGLNALEYEDADPVGEFAGERPPQTIALVPGAFKPPHKGHADMVHKYATGKGVEKADKVYVIISAPAMAKRKLRDGTEVTAQHAIDAWRRLYPEVANLPEVEFEMGTREQASPVTIAYDYIGGRSKLDLQAGDNIILGASKKDDDWKRWREAPKYIRPDLNLLAGVKYAVDPYTRSDGEDLRASDLRDLISDVVEDPNNTKAKNQLAEYVPKDKIDVLFSILGLAAPTKEEEALDETSVAVGMAGAVGAQGGPWKRGNIKKQNKEEEEKSRLKRENVDLSMVDEVIRLFMERGIMR
jgi:hypothetical protein